MRVTWILSLLLLLTACKRFTEDSTVSESMSSLVYAEVEVAITGTTLELKKDASSENNPYYGMPYEADLRAYCNFRVKKGLYRLETEGTGTRIRAEASDKDNFLNDLLLVAELKGKVAGLQRSRSQALASNRDYKIVASNPVLTVNESRTKIRIEVSCRIFR